MAEEGRLLPRDTAFQALLTVIDDLRRRPKEGRSPKQLGDELVHLRRATDLLELEFSETAGALPPPRSTTPRARPPRPNGSATTAR